MSFLGELKRRNVIRVAMAYVVAAWLVIQVVETVFPAFGFGPGAVRLAVIGLAVLFIPVLVLAWVFELTPEGLRSVAEMRDAGGSLRSTGRRLDQLILALLALALAYFAIDKFVLDPARDRQQVEDARREGRSEAVAETYGDQSIAVLPFTNLSDDPQQEYFSDGMTEELLNLLSRVPGLRVISRTSAFSFKDSSLRIPDIARELGVRYVLEGSVRQAGDRVRITTQLIDATADRHLWSESYERPLADIFAIQDEVAESVLPAIQHRVTGQTPTVIRTDPATYSLHLQAVHFFLQRTASGLERAVEYSSRALEIDPDYAPAWITLASAYINQVNRGSRPREEGYRLAIEAIDRALDLAPEYPLAHSARAWVAMSFERDYAAAAAHFRRATALAPNSGVVLGNRAVLAVALGRLDEARRLTERGIELDPVNSVGYANRADQLIRLDRPVEAEQAARKALALSPGMSHAQGNLALAQLLQERPADALASAQLDDNDAARHYVLALAHYAAGNWQAADQALTDLKRQHAGDAAYFIGVVYAWRGEIEDAFVWLNRAMDENQSTFGLRTEPFLRVLYDDPRWLETLEKAGLAPDQVDGIVL